MDPKQCELSRRDFVGLSLAGLVGLMAPVVRWRGLLGAVPEPRAKSLIVLWMAGGPSHIDTFDPKPGTDAGGPWKAIATSVKGLRLSEHFPALAAQAHEIAVVRSLTSKEGSHGRATYYLHTGYIPTPTVRHPGLGAIISKEASDPEHPLPAFVSLGGPSSGGGYLGQEYSPFVVQDPPGQPVRFLEPLPEMDPERFRARMELSAALDEAFARRGAAREARAHSALMKRAWRMMESPKVAAFDCSVEPAAVKERYGLSEFGQRCLTARRLVEAGVSAVEVTLGGWDTHQDNFTRSKELIGQLDPAFSALVQDLRERDLLDSTLILCLGEFGRTPKINRNDGRDHHSKAFSAVLAGGGIKGGTVVGATDPRGDEVVAAPVTVPDLFATVCHLMGIDGTKVYWSNARPNRLVDKGRVITEALAT